jgi:hypothetical protein
VSAELAKTKPGADQEGARTILCDNDSVFVFYRVARRYGLPVVPEWAPWFMRELNQRKAIRSLLGLGCSPVVVSGNKAHIPQIDWQGFTRRVDRNTQRQWINNLEVAEDFPVAAAELAQMIVRDGRVAFTST